MRASLRLKPLTIIPPTGELWEKKPTRKNDPNKKIVILGSGPNRIGQGIEFDYSCVRSVKKTKEFKVPNSDDQLQSRDGVYRL